MKINFKRTWWIILLMVLYLGSLCAISAIIDFAVHHADIASDMMNTTFIDKYTYQDLLMILHFSYGMSLITGLIICIWMLLFSLFKKYNK